MTSSLAELVDNMEDKDADAGTTTDTGTGDASGSDKSGDDKSATSGAGKDESGHGDSDSGTESAESSTGTEDKPADDDSGYIADEVETEEPVTSPNELPPELKYIVDNLPTLTVRGKSANGATKTYQVKAAGQLPEDFEFATKREELIFTQALAAQELKAQNLQAQFQTKQQQAQASKYSEQENTDIRHDIGELQREGKLSKFKYPSNDKRFNDDPAVKEAQAVMEYMNKKNEAYVKEGKLYRISFADAYDQYQAVKPGKDKEDAQAREDQERKAVTRRTGGSSSASANSTPKYRPAPSFGSLIDRIDNLDWS